MLSRAHLTWVYGIGGLAYIFAVILAILIAAFNAWLLSNEGSLKSLC